MIEALAMLGLISMVTPVIYKKAAERTTEMQDINAASQVRVIVKAIDDYLRDNYTTITAGGKVESKIDGSVVDYGKYGFGAEETDTDEKTTKPISITHFSDYLPLGFQPKGKLFKEFKVAIKQTRDPSGERKALTTVLVAKTSTDGKVDPAFTRLRSARIASMIGTNGGYVDGDIATGVQGVWQIKKDDLPDTNVDAGTIVATSIEAVADGTAGGKNVLHRVDTPGRPEYNTMETALNMGGHDVNNLVNLIAAGDKITITKRERDSTSTADVNLIVEGETNVEDTLSAARENFIANSVYMQHTTGLFVGNNTEAACSSPDDTSCGAKFYVDGKDGRIRAATGNFTVSGEGNTTMAGYADIGDYANVKGYLNALEGNFTVAYNKTSDPTLAFAKDVITADKNKITNNVPSFIVKNAAGGTADFFDGMLNINAKDTEKPLLNNRVTVGTNLDVYGFVHIDNDVEIEGSLSSSYNVGYKGYNFFSDSDSVQAGKMSGSDKYGLNVDAGTGTTIFEAKVIANKDGDKIFDIDDTTDGYTTAKKLQAGYGSQTNFPGYNFDVNDSESDSVKLGATYKDYRTDKGWKSHNLTVGNYYAAVEGELKVGKKQIGEKYTYAATFQDNQIDTQTNEFNINSGVGDSLIKIDGNVVPSNDGSAPIYMRKGVIEIARNDDKTGSNPTGYIKADRLLSNIEKDSDADKTMGIYNFEVNPAYTSMMHDIKLATRGGARLSDILPDFINKGIYVMDNTYYVQTGTGDWTSGTIEKKDGDFRLTEVAPCDNTKCDTSPWMGFIPTPNCPPHYMKVATITPIRFAMAQAGVPVSVPNDSKGTTGIEGSTVSNIKNYRLLGTRKDPRGDKIEVGRGSDYARTGDTVVAVFENSEGNNIKSDEQLVFNPAPEYWAEVYNAPYTFQVSTWLNTTIKAYYVGTGKDKKFKGWHGIMGFIYPAKDYEDYADAIGVDISNVNNNTIFWNLFPVYKEELSAIATVYCYFDRSSFSDEYVDPYLAHTQTMDNIRDKTKGESTDTNNTSANYIKRLNDPKLDYGNAYW